MIMNKLNNCSNIVSLVKGVCQVFIQIIEGVFEKN